MTAEIDLRQVASFTSIPESTVSALLENPTVELVRTLLQNIASKVSKHEELKSQKLKQDIELETAIRGNESKVKVLKHSVDKGLAEVGRLRTELQQSENARSKLESEVAQIKSSSSSEASEASTLKSRIASLEASNRDTLAVLESKSTAYDKLADDLSAQHQKSVELRHQVSTLEQNLQAANSASASTRFREQNLGQEIELLKRNNEWFETELKTKSEEYLRFRKDKSARISELQRQNEQTISENDNLKRAESALRSRVDEQVQTIEDHLATVQELKEAAIQSAENFRLELESVGRLAELQEASANTAKARAQELSVALEEIKEEAADEIGRLRAEAETEQEEKDAAEKRVTELESAVEGLEADLASARAIETPGRAINGHGTTTPTRAGTPTAVFSPSSASRTKGGLSMTQMYTEYRKLEKQLATEQRTNEELSNAMDEMLKDLETSKPEIEEMRTDHARLEGEMVEMSALMDTAGKDREEAVKEARRCRGEIESLSREGDILRQQLRDLSSQVKTLLMEQHLRENGQNLSADETAELKAAASVSAAELDGMNDTGRVISEHLTTFKNVAELSESNTKLLRMIRELGDRMESNEAREKEQVHQKEHEELQQLRIKVSTYKDEVQGLVKQGKAYVKERDMFRSMLTRRGPLPSHIDPNNFAQSMPLPAGESAPSPPQRFGESLQGGSGVDHVDYASLLKDLQMHFDTYKQEAASDHTALKNQVSELSRKNSQLQTDAARTESQLSYANQHGERQQANFDMLKTEKDELQKRTYSVMENATKQELKAQQIAEELVEVRGTLDSMRRETANLKAEKDLWKNIEKRLVEDNESLRNERVRLDNLNSSLQNILNEREQADSETRRRLQNSVDSLEAELQANKRRLNDELDESRKATLRREYEHEQNQKRIDDLVTSLGTAREELSAAKTSKDHLQARVDEMTIELRSAEERLQVLQSKPLPEQAPQEQQSSQNIVSREQELAVEVSELKRDLELKANEVERANEQIEDYKGISQASEERLQELSDTNDQYREETDRLLEERYRKIQDLEQRIGDISSELATTNNELSKVRDEQSESGRKLEDQKSVFEAEIARLKDDGERHAAAAQFHQEDLKAQAEIAQHAQQNYENELLKHAEAAKTLQTVRGEANQLKLEVVELKSVADSAGTSLAQKEESWSEQKDRYERELADLKRRREEVMQQNTILHKQLEGVTHQITAVQRDRAALAEGDTGNASSSSGLENLQEVIKYLRREKEIVDVQYHLSTQEAKRLRQQLDHAQSQLDETRLKLDQQRRAEADTERNALNHSRLMETLNELNLFRESSVTLRAQYREAETNLAEKTKRVDELMTEIEPLQIRIGELENLTETREGEMKLLQEDRDRWQQRTQNILQKYDRVDPVEVEAQKEKLVALEKERDDAVAERLTLQQQVDAFPEQLATEKQDLRNRLGEQFKTRSKQLTTRIQEKQAELDTANNEKAGLETQIQTMKSDNEVAAATTRPAEESSQLSASELPAQPASNDDEKSARIAELEGKVRDLESSLAAKEQELQRMKTEHDQRYRKRDAELREVFNKKARELRTELQKSKDDALKELEEQLKGDYEQELETVRSTAAQSGPGKSSHVENTARPSQSPATNGDTSAHVAPSSDDLPELSDNQVRHLIQKSEVVKNVIRNNIRKAVEKEKENMRKDLEAAQAAATESVSSTSLDDLEKKHATEKDSLAKELEAKLAAEREAIVKEQGEKLENERLAFSKESERKIADQVAMAEKRSAVKLNMAQNQAKTATFRLDIVKKAANDTPEKHVKEVWDEASVAKPPPGSVQAPTQVNAAQALKPPTPTPALTAVNANSQPEPQAPVPTQEAAPTTIQNATQTAMRAPTPNNQQSNAAPAVSAIPVKPVQNNHIGTGPAALRGLQSGLPRGRGGRAGHQGQLNQQNAQTTPAAENTFGQPSHPQQAAAARGSGIPRGGLRGRGGQARAGAQTVQTSGLPQSGQGTAAASSTTAGSSPRGNLNPNAKQFNPGNKRAREDGEGTADANAGKRPRGGGAAGQ